MQENKSIATVRGNIFTKAIDFIKKLFINKKIESSKICIDKAKTRKTKEELVNIYAKAKRGEYDLDRLEIEDIEMLNKMIEAEIAVRTKKLDEIVTDTKMKQYILKQN